MQVLTQCIEQCGPCIDHELAGLAVHVEGHLRHDRRSSDDRRLRLRTERHRSRCGGDGSENQKVAPGYIEVVEIFHVVCAPFFGHLINSIVALSVPGVFSASMSPSILPSLISPTE